MQRNYFLIWSFWPLMASGLFLITSGHFFAPFSLNWHKSDCFTLYQAVFQAVFESAFYELSRYIRFCGWYFNNISIYYIVYQQYNTVIQYLMKFRPFFLIFPLLKWKWFLHLHHPKLRRGGWVADTSSLLNCRTGNCTGGSNPPLSAVFWRSGIGNGQVWKKFLKEDENISGCSAARLAHLVWDQGVPGSNPGTPTKREYNPAQKTINHWFMVFLFFDYFHFPEPAQIWQVSQAV